MEFIVKQENLEQSKQKNACIIVGIFKSCQLSLTAKKLDEVSGGYISALLSKGGWEGKLGQILSLYYIPNTLYKRVLLIGCGRENNLNGDRYQKIIEKTVNSLNDTGLTEATCFLTELYVKDYNMYWKIRKAVESTQEAIYKFDELKTDKKKSCYSLRKIIFNMSNSCELNIGERAIQHGLAISAGIKAAKDLGNLPPNICNTTYLASKAQKLEDLYGKNIITTFIVNEKQMYELGMYTYLAVGNSSKNESLMAVVEYKGSSDKDTSPIVLVGKGLTFDSGGISIKPNENMDEMKYDMCGAAAVYGVMLMAAELRIPLRIIGILACCENMPGGHSYRPGDILTTMSGKTVEILNTDAEGRLVLCDVLTYVERFNPRIVIDIATLTGACVIALGNHITGLMSNYDPLAHELIIASQQSGDKVWKLPLDDKYQEQLKSNFADITNVGGRPAGAITAGCFLSNFTQKYNWAHLDIAGTAWRSGKKKGATGRPVAMLSQFLLNQAGFKNQ